MSFVFDAVTRFDALYASMRKCANGVRWKDATARYLADGLKETYRLRRELREGTYQIRPYHHFVITDPKRREVMATHIRDRQLQRALCDGYLYRQITKGCIRDNFACQEGRGMDDALDRMDCHLHRFYRKHGASGWVLKCDVKKYFASTSHEVAKAAVAKRVPDEDVRKAVFAIIDSFGGDMGIGLGSQVSQLIELAVLDDLDHYIKERLRIKHYLRYMDDIVLIHESREHLERCLAEIQDKLAQIGLTLNAKTSLFPLRHGIRWLQRRFLVTPSGRVLRKLGKKTVTRERKKLRNIKRKGLPPETAATSFLSWAASAERRRAKRNRERRLAGKPVRLFPETQAVERMRAYFISIYGFDPYSEAS